MHEISVISSIIQLVKIEMDKLENVKIVKEVHLEVGDITFLSHDQLRFGFERMTESDPRINSLGLIIRPIKTIIKCLNCNYKGDLKMDVNEGDHLSLPVFACPECQGRIDIIEGKECVLKNLVIDLEKD